MSNTISRREVVAAGAAAALATLGRSSCAGAGAPVVEPLLLLDGTLASADLAAARSLIGSWSPRTLKPDLVWEWRDDLGRRLAQGGRAVAITRWDKALLLSGLAREAALPVRQMRIGRNSFRTDIG